MNILKNRNNVITYTVNKVSNTGIYISVQNGEVIINAPWYMASSQIQRIVEEKKQWIINKIEEYEKVCDAKKVKESKKKFTKMETVKVLGKNYNVNIEYKSVKTPTLAIEKMQIKVILPSKYKKIENAEVVELLMKKMYETIANKEIERVMEKTRIETGMAPEDYEIVKMPNTLAKCVNGKITINTNIAMYKKEVIEYVILHEFCHLKYKNHTKSFYNMLETYMPNYEEYANEIKNQQY